jgi:predicted dehydrogenase
MLRGALIGLGNIALRGHLPAYRRQDAPARLGIVAACDISASAAATCAAELPGAAFYPGVEEMLRAEKPDFVDICTPPHTHAQYIRLAAAGGAHVLCEKPLSDRFEAIDGIRASLAGRGTVFVPCHQYRYSPLWSTVASVITSGRIGRVTLAQFNVYRTQADAGSPAGNPAWRTDRTQSGGGILADTGAHYFYLVQHFFGLPLSVQATLRTLRHVSYGVEDTALVALEYDGAAVQISLTWAADSRANSMVVAGTRGSLRYDGTRLVLSTGGGTPAPPEVLPMPDVSDKNQYIGWYASLLGEFAGRIREKKYDDDLLRESINVMKLLDLCYRSGAERRTLEFR